MDTPSAVVQGESNHYANAEMVEKADVLRVGQDRASEILAYSGKPLHVHRGTDDFVAKRHLPVFTLVQSRLMMRWVAGSRALITNSFFCIASSG